MNTLTTSMTVLLASAALSTGAALRPPSGLAQEADSTVADTVTAADTIPADSLVPRIELLEQRLRALRARLDSLSHSRPDTAQAEGDLAALQRAARRAAEEAKATVQDTSGGGGSRTRSLQALNPEISVAGDIVGNVTSPGGPEDADATAVPRSIELSFQAALDPKSRMKVFAVREEEFPVAGLGGDEEGGEGGGGMDVEEAYMYWVGLPGGFGARVGKFRQRFGLYNRWHSHALMDVDRPLPYKEFLGESLVQTGAGVTLPSVQVGPSGNTLAFEVARGSNEKLFGSSNELTYAGRYESFFDLSPAAYFQLGSSALYGENDETDLTSKVLAFDASFRWQPPGRALYQDLRLKAEWFLADRDRGPEDLDGHGGYVQAHYQFDRQWVAGARADYVDRFGPGPDLFQLAPSITYWQSEWVRLRAQYNFVQPDGGPDNHSFLLQVVWAAGPHKHDKY